MRGDEGSLPVPLPLFVLCADAAVDDDVVVGVSVAPADVDPLCDRASERDDKRPDPDVVDNGKLLSLSLLSSCSVASLSLSLSLSVPLSVCACPCADCVGVCSKGDKG